MSTKQEEKTAYQRLHDLENELADVLRRIRRETYLGLQEAMRHYFEESPDASKEEARIAFQELLLIQLNEGDPLLGGQLLDALAHFSSPLNKANRAFQIAATSKYHLQFSHSKDTYSSSQGRMQVYEQTIKDATLSAWQDARYKDLRAWSQDETRVVWLP